MAISDVLWNAVNEIERYLEDDVMSRMYTEPELRAKIDTVVSAMRKLREELDAPPSEEDLRSANTR
jgi:hypothetical protein